MTLAILLVPSLAHSEQPAPPTLGDILHPVEFGRAVLSPSGRYLAAIRLSKGKKNLITADLDAPDFQVVEWPLKKTEVDWLHWVSDDRLILASSHSFDISYNNQNFRSWAFRQVVSMSRDGQHQLSLFNKDDGVRATRGFASVTSFLPQDPNHVLMPARKDSRLHLYKVNVQTGNYWKMADGSRNTIMWFTNSAGHPAIRLDTNSRRTIVFIRTPKPNDSGGLDWEVARSFHIKRNRRERESFDFYPLSPGPTEATYYVIGRPEGRDTIGVHLFDYESNTLIETIKEVPGVDIHHAYFDPRSGDFAGVRYYDKNQMVIELQDKTFMAHLRGLKSYFGEDVNVHPLQQARQGDRWLLYSEGPQDPGSYHLYDVAKTHVRGLSIKRPALLNHTLASVETIDYTARDGLALSGYLTIPAHTTPGIQPPLVMLPHGGPEIRDYFEFNDDAQIFAAHGYQVFQPNFRGSGGFGQAFAERGYGQWGRAMQDDIDDAFDHLVATKRVDANRACIVGASYGGYVALMALTREGQPYRCGIAAAAVTELSKQLQFDRRESGKRSEEYKYLVRQMGDPRTDKKEMAKYSPSNNADAIDVPLLLMHGDADDVVPIDQSEQMAKALKKAGKPHQFLRFEGGDHSFGRKRDAEKYYKTMLRFLDKHLPAHKTENTKQHLPLR